MKALRMLVHYNDSSVYQIDIEDEADGKVLQEATSISQHEAVDHVDVWMDNQSGFPYVVHLLEGFALPS